MSGEEEGIPNRLLLEALTTRMQRMLREELEGIHERIDRVENFQ